MKVHFVDLASPALSSLAQRFRERGDVVSHSAQSPADADVYIFNAGNEIMKRLTRGLVALDLRQDAELVTAPWVSYADVCFVHDAAARVVLVERHNCEPERIYPASDENTLIELVTLAVRDELPPAERIKRDQAETGASPASLVPDAVALATRLDMLERQADVMLRGYRVRSRVPLFGPFIAWVRRNLTSHLREPYLDPALERQVALNSKLVGILREVLSQQAELEARLARLEETGDNDG